MIKRLVIGSTYPAKIKDWKSFLGRFLTVSGVSELGKFIEPEETGATFAENARIKAIHYALLTGEFVFAEDGGYEIEALGGWPGIKSRRVLQGDKEGTDDELINCVLKKLKGLPLKKRKVRLTFASALSNPKGEVIFEGSGSSVGFVAEKVGPIRIPGYPFRSVHWMPELNKTYAELTLEEHKKYSHKKPIAEELIKFLKNHE